MVRILFLHPDLGIGGAERLVVDAALALKHKGHKVSFLTNHHDVNHCFEETRNGTFTVDAIGDWLPRNIFGKCYALCAYLRMLYAAAYVAFVSSHKEKYDIILCDQISLGIPILKLAKHSPRILFYCHFPDQLLSAKGSILKQIYRAPLNFLEEYTMGLANTVLVNSKFTSRIYSQTFRRISKVPDVLYPSINTKFFDNILSLQNTEDILKEIPKDHFIFLSINRFERKKNLPLAIESFKRLQIELTRIEWEKCNLIIAGGYDTRVIENVHHYKELVALTTKLSINDKVIFLRSPSDEQKTNVLKRSNCLLYTPENEHFGIVPLEGMYLSKPVVALNSGGPTETIVQNSTGILCENDVDSFCEAMIKLLRDQTLAKRMGEMGRKRVQQKFSFEAFTEKLNFVVNELLNNSN